MSIRATEAGNVQSEPRSTTGASLLLRDVLRELGLRAHRAPDPRCDATTLAWGRCDLLREHRGEHVRLRSPEEVATWPSESKQAAADGWPTRDSEPL